MSTTHFAGEVRSGTKGVEDLGRNNFDHRSPRTFDFHEPLVVRRRVPRRTLRNPNLALRRQAQLIDVRAALPEEHANHVRVELEHGVRSIGALHGRNGYEQDLLAGAGM